MRRVPWPFFALALPLAEIAGFVLVGRWLGVWAVLGLVVAAAFAGAAILRGRLSALQSAVRGRSALTALGAVADESLLALGAVLLMLPGFLSDLAAVPLLIPPARRAILAALASRVAVHARHPVYDDGIIEGEVIDIDAVRGQRSPPDDTPRPPSAWTRH